MSQGFAPAADEPPAAECATIAADYDWSESDLGPRDQWDPVVDAVVRTLLETSAPMAYCHGASYAMVYNDRFADLLGATHPRSWGQRAANVMPEIWARPGFAEAIDSVFDGGPPFHDDGEMVDLTGTVQPHPNCAYLARSYSAVRDAEDSVLGILVVVVEIAPVLVLVDGAAHGDDGAARWHGTELWDETAARESLIWSGFRAGVRAPEPAVAEPGQRFVADGSGQRILPINGPDIPGSLGYRGVRRNLPDIRMVTLAVRGQNDTTGTGSGADFYDVFGMPDGRIAITIGQLVGAGMAAAPVAAQIRVGLRGATLTSSDPNVIFTALDELVSHLDRTWPPGPGRGQGAGSDRPGFGGELFATTLLGVFDPASGDLLLASAGHVPPAVVHRQGAADPSGASGSPPAYAEVDPGPPLGIPGTRPVFQMVLQEGDALVAVTERLLELRDQDVIQGRAALLEALSTMPATAARSISQHVVDNLVGDQDCALLVVVHDSRAHQEASVLVPPHTIAVGGARRWVQAQLESWGLDEVSTANAVLFTSELVTNVVQHAGTSARLTMELADRLLVTVEDAGTWSAPRIGREDHSAAQGRGLALVAAISDAMGHSRGVDGSTVWFELRLHRETP
ncbi:MAG TPA: ATP-binding SpoIIE family protein phosphatase [Dermatophilaceae bacterium]|nr:ATP-binding SpoIIE family protein phosphatase [Dermatophilaceae bacterium]